MSSLSAMSHAGQSSSSGQGGTDPNHSPTLMASQRPNHPVQHIAQSDHNNRPYVPVHSRAHAFGASASPEGYQHHVMPYVPQGHSPPDNELMYAEQTSRSQETNESEPIQGNEGSPSPSTANGNRSFTSRKRKHPDSATPEGSARKRRQRVLVHAGENGDGDGDMQDVDVGPNGGPKHWTEDEKSRFFTWMLTNDEHWDAFRTRMNTVFRECSNELFPGRKSYTALKSCFHRNLEVFKQIHAFQLFSANRMRQRYAENSNAEQPTVEAMLEAARAAGLNVGTLNAKIIDRWYETGWYELFRRRYRDDPKTGLPVPYYGPNDAAEAGPSTASAPSVMMDLHPHASIDPQLMESHPALHSTGTGSVQHAASPEPYQPPSSPSVRHSGHNGTYLYPSLASQSPDYRQSGSSASYAAAPPYLRSANAATPVHNASSRSSTQLSQPDNAAQIAQMLAKFNTVVESFLSISTSLKAFVEQQAEESRVRTETLRAEAAQRQQGAATPIGQEHETEKEISIEKVTFATEILKNGPENEDIKKAAIECLTKYLMRGL